MKVLSPKQMSDIESQAYRDGASDFDFMEEAGSGVALVVHDYVERRDLDRLIILLCGRGNNGGDAYVAGIHLLHLDYEVLAIRTDPMENCSRLCRQSYERFTAEGGRVLEYLSEFPPSGVIVDGIFGTGFRGTVEGSYFSLIQQANASSLPIIAIDIPSGLNGETGEVSGAAIIAAETAFLGVPKLGFFIGDGWNHVGKLRHVDFGLRKEYYETIDCRMIMSTDPFIRSLLPKLKRNQHKYQAGYVVGLAGSRDMPGAAILASLAALRGGAGIVKLLYPSEITTELTTAPYELIKIPFNPVDPQDAIDLLNKANAVFVGPGLGRTNKMIDLIQTTLESVEKPCVLDADGLFALAERNFELPRQTVLTPHLGEMARLLKVSTPITLSPNILDICQAYAEEKNVTLVLKGGPSFIFHPNSPIYVNPTGDPGMATAGSGDVLTGLIASFLSQGMPPQHAAYSAVFLHGLAGEHAAHEMSSRGVIASDIIFHFPEAFQFYAL